MGKRAASTNLLNFPQSPCAAASHSETLQSGLGPSMGLQAGFVAQVLGQILATHKADPLQAARIYADVERGPDPTRFVGWT